MASVKEKVAVNLLVDHFGDIVAQTVTCLLAKGPRSMRDLSAETKLKLNEVRKGLLVAVQHDLVFTSEKKAASGSLTIIYTSTLKQVLQRLHIPHLKRLACCAVPSQPLVAQHIIEHLLLNGRLCLGAIVQHSKTLSSTSVSDQSHVPSSAGEVFSVFAREHLVCRTDGSEEDRFALPQVDIDDDSVANGSRKRGHSPDCNAPAAKRSASSGDAHKCSGADDPTKGSGEHGDADCLWKVNFPQMLGHLRDEAIVVMVSESLDAAAGAVVSTLLRLASIKDVTNGMTASITSFELFQALPSTPLLSRAELSLYLKLLADGAGALVSKVGENAGGTYCINLDQCLKDLVEQAVLSVVQERFGSKCLRIFRLLLEKNHLEEKQVGDMAMIPAKEAKDLLYRMIRDHFVTFQEIPRTPDHAPARTFYLFSVNRQHVAKTCLQIAYKSLLSLQQRRLSLEKEHRRLLERQQQFELQKVKILGGGGESREEDVSLLEEDLLPPADKAMVKKIQNAFARLDEGEHMAADSILRLSEFDFHN